ncbi:hypothetical protein D3C72_2274200 [compost metagenome]
MSRRNVCGVEIQLRLELGESPVHPRSRLFVVEVDLARFRIDRLVLGSKGIAQTAEGQQGHQQRHDGVSSIHDRLRTATRDRDEA